MFSKLLVPVDGSENSFRALDHAIFLAKIAAASVTAIHVIENPPTVYIESQRLLDDLLASYRSESAKVLDKCQQKAEVGGVRLEKVVSQGDVALSITTYARTGNFDLIVIGTRGLGRFKEIVLGSISNKVLQHAKCSVLIVK